MSDFERHIPFGPFDRGFESFGVYSGQSPDLRGADSSGSWVSYQAMAGDQSGDRVWGQEPEDTYDRYSADAEANSLDALSSSADMEGVSQDDTFALELGAAETALETPEAEQRGFATGLEQFAAGGQRYEETLTGNDGSQYPGDRGYKRELPEVILEERGIGYKVEVMTVEARGDEPYAVGLTATREVPYETSVSIGPDESDTVSVTLEGEEAKDIAFFFSGPEKEGDNLAIEMNAGSSLIAPRSGTIELDLDEHGVATVQIGIMIDESGPLLRLDEARAIKDAIDFANQLPPNAPEFQSRYLPPYRGVESTEFVEQGEVFTDLPQERRQQFVNEIDSFARAAGVEPVERNHVRRYERVIPVDILRAHGIAGEVTAVVQEGIDYNHYRYGFRTDEPLSKVFPGHEELGALPGKKEAFFGFYEVGGKRDGTHGMGNTTDETGGNGVHTTYGGQIFYWRNEADLLASDLYKVWQSESIPDITFDEARRLYEALRQANAAGDM